MRERPILIAYRRFEQLQELLFARGYLVDPGGRDPNEWRDDPPLGLVRLKGVAMRGDGDDAEPDPRVTFSIAELWSADRVEDAFEEHGYWLAGYSYHGQVGGVSSATASTLDAIRRCPTTAIPPALWAGRHGDKSPPKKHWKGSTCWWPRSEEPDGCSEPPRGRSGSPTIEGMATVSAEEAIHVQNIGHLSDRDIARATGAAPSTVREWLTGLGSPSGADAERLAELSSIVERLARVIQPTYISEHLRSPESAEWN